MNEIFWLCDCSNFYNLNEQSESKKKKNHIHSREFVVFWSHVLVNEIK